MQPTTVDVIRAALRSDPTVTPADRGRLLALVRNGGTATAPAAPTGPRLLRRTEAARMLACSLRTLDSLAAAGTLPRVTLPGRRRAAGFREADLQALIEGGRA
jgi:predicted DNA-binding transcriptional regulator AlpA